jgi:hypothetical protein
VAQLYHRALGSLSVASYDSQGHYGGGILVCFYKGSLDFSGLVFPYVPHDGPLVTVHLPAFVRYRGSTVGKPLLRDGRLPNLNYVGGSHTGVQLLIGKSARISVLCISLNCLQLTNQSPNFTSYS